MFMKINKLIAGLGLIFLCFIGVKLDAFAVDFPAISVTFDEADQSVIVSGIPSYDATGTIQYELRGYLNYGDERVDTFCYAPSVYPYHIADSQAYIFNWADCEFLLPCSGEYQFTAYLVANVPTGQDMRQEKGTKTTIPIKLTKKDESTNWGPGLPNTTVEAYDLKQIQGKDKTICVEEDGYTWTINGSDIENVPEENLSLKITVNPENFQTQGVEEFFGGTIASVFSIDYSGEFGFKAMLDYYVGTEYVGKYADLFYVIGDGHFEFMESALIEEDGKAAFTFTHASDYIIAVTDMEYIGQELNPKVTDSPEEIKEEENIMDSEESKEADDMQVTETVLPTETPIQDNPVEEPEVPVSDADEALSSDVGNDDGYPMESIAVIVAIVVIVGVVGFVMIRKRNK